MTVITDKKVRLGDVLVEGGYVTSSQLEEALTVHRETGKRLGTVLIEGNYITHKHLAQALESQLGINSINLKTAVMDPKIVKIIPENLARRYNILPVHVSNGSLVLAMDDPLNQGAIQDVRLLVQMPVVPVIAGADEIKAYLDKFFSHAMATKAATDFLKSKGVISSNLDEITGEMDVNAAPIVRLVNSVIEGAVRSGASDIHIEHLQDHMRVRIRVDGILQNMLETDAKTHNTVISRIKVMSGLNIAEKRTPQDGRFMLQIDGKDIDFRVSSMPTNHGEKIVMRILDKSTFTVGKSNLGLEPEDEKKFEKLISHPFGIILVTGPTGSGKTTTLYSMLSEMNDSQKNILTLEDPVEYDMKGINQSQINIKAGLDFSIGLRAFLRQDPDIIMVGEIRDSDTAEIAVRAALTGHLVLSTLHTNNAPGAVARLIDMGIEPYLISTSLNGVIAQRLVRKICDECREEYTADEREKHILDYPKDKELKLFRGKGCEYCNGTGYKGRTGVFEILEINRDIRALIDNKATTDELFEEAYGQGMTTLKEDAVRKVINGITTVNEMLRATY